jgi:hypothetical protein
VTRVPWAHHQFPGTTLGYSPMGETRSDHGHPLLMEISQVNMSKGVRAIAWPSVEASG